MRRRVGEWKWDSSSSLTSETALSLRVIMAGMLGVPKGNGRSLLLLELAFTYLSFTLSDPLFFAGCVMVPGWRNIPVAD